MKRRYNYLSHMVDSATDSVTRVAKISAFWASTSQAILIINLVIYLGANVIAPITLVLLSFLLWVSVFGIMIVVQLGWIAHLVFNGIDGDYDQMDASPSPTAIDVTKHYEFDGKRHKITKIVESPSGVGGSLPKNPDLAKMD